MGFGRVGLEVKVPKVVVAVSRIGKEHVQYLGLRILGTNNLRFHICIVPLVENVSKLLYHLKK